MYYKLTSLSSFDERSVHSLVQSDILSCPSSALQALQAPRSGLTEIVGLCPSGHACLL